MRSLLYPMSLCILHAAIRSDAEKDHSEISNRHGSREDSPTGLSEEMLEGSEDQILPIYGNDWDDLLFTFDDLVVAILAVPYSIICMVLQKEFMIYLYELIRYYWE
jgi:hypothetical protein